jgi:hypothetical protein
MKDYYERLLRDCGAVLDASFAADRDGLMPRAHSFIADLETWHAVLEGRLEQRALAVAAREYQYALMAVAIGQYRQAFGSLRTYLELTCAALHFSAIELDMRLWLQGERDVSWARLADGDNGVLSHSFARAFYPGLKDDVTHYRELAKKVYRECSEFVHANPHTHEIIPGQVEFNEDMFFSWQEKAASARLVATFALVLRYLQTLPEGLLPSLEGPVLDQLSHIEAVRYAFNTETTNADA